MNTTAKIEWTGKVINVKIMQWYGLDLWTVATAEFETWVEAEVWAKAAIEAREGKPLPNAIVNNRTVINL